MLLLFINSIHKLRNEFEGLLSRMANEFTEGPRRIAFLINNYDVIASVFQVTDESAGYFITQSHTHLVLHRKLKTEHWKMN